MRVLLHACCGPCLLEPIDDLRQSHEVKVAYANSNIHPVEEYIKRRDALLRYCAEEDVECVELEYEPVTWMRAVAGVEDDPSERCRRCYRLRMAAAATIAAEEGFDAFATTLTVSPYQDEEAIRQMGEEVSQQTGVHYLHQDYRDRYPEATRRSREMEMYRQNYCGCLLSDVEAREQRRARRQSRQAAKGSGGESA